VTRYAVLDDDSDMDVVYKNFFKTCSWDGLKKDVAKKVIMHLNEEAILDHYRMNFALNKFLTEYRSCFDNIEGFKETENVIISSLKNLDNIRKEKCGKQG
jgi:membrane-bound lytic murein transglycosylase MltF